MHLPNTHATSVSTFLIFRTNDDGSYSLWLWFQWIKQHDIQIELIKYLVELAGKL